jgi:hypothetical protein
MTRCHLPNLRPSVTVTVHWNGQAFPVTIGFHPDTGAPSEAFADVAKGGDLQWVIADACVLISIAMQHGIAPADLAKSLGRVPTWGDDGATAPASPVGAVMDAILAEVTE